jgi:hypothetical protein
LRVDEFARMRHVIEGFGMWIATVFVVKAAQRGGEARGIGWLKL